jgi:thymidine phosphorylase
VTATVESIPLIAASIMSKKLAEGIGGLVLDVKRGSGAFLPDIERVLELTRTMIRLGAAGGCRVVALVTAMDRPLGFAVGNALETEEAILALRGEGPDDLRELTLALTAEMLVLAGVADSVDAARASAAAALDDGRALEKMREIVIAQGGDPFVLDDPALLPQADSIAVLEADRAGVIASMDARAIGRAAVALGAGRASIEDRIDPRVGFHITAKPGMRVDRGEPLATVHGSDEVSALRGVEALRATIEIADSAEPPLPLVSHRVSSDGVHELA